MPFRDKFTIAFTVLILVVGPYLTYKMIESGMNKDVSLAQTISDSATEPSEREVAQIKRRHLTPIVFGQVAMFILTQAGAVTLSALIIREHKRRRAK
jgi:hypothetical protein